jgi:hypothetical protein
MSERESNDAELRALFEELRRRFTAYRQERDETRKALLWLWDNKGITPLPAGGELAHLSSQVETARAAATHSLPLDQRVTIARDAYHKVMAQREEIIEAFMAKYGIEPDELLQVERETPTGRIWSVERRAARNEGT